MTQKWVTSFVNIARVNTKPFLNLKRDLADLEYNIPENRSFYWNETLQDSFSENIFTFSGQVFHRIPFLLLKCMGNLVESQE